MLIAKSNKIITGLFFSVAEAAAASGGIDKFGAFHPLQSANLLHDHLRQTHSSFYHKSFMSVVYDNQGDFPAVVGVNRAGRI